MRRGQTKGERGLTRLVQTKITEKRFNTLEALVSQTKGETISSVVRKIIESKSIKVYTHDESLDLIMEELAAHRAEICSIGVNINQMAKLFNSYPQLKTKMFYAEKGYDRYLLLEDKIDRLLEIVSDLAHVWLTR